MDHADWGEKFSEKYVEQSLRAILAEARSGGGSDVEATKRASKAFAAFIERLDGYTQEQTCYVPLVGLRLSEGDLELGQVVLEEFSKEKLD